MTSVEQFIVDPGSEDVRVDQIFVPTMFERIIARMEEVDMPHLETVRQMWQDDFRARRVVSQFLRDGAIGKKRLASMPDRITNTIRLASGGTAFRPAVGNCYPGELRSLEDWFDQWIHFIFDTKVDLDGSGHKPVHALLQRIKRSKYPAVTDLEEAASVPLQVLVQGIFDATLVNLMLSKGGTTWQSLRREICESLNSRKSVRIAEVLQNTYDEADIVFLQEAGGQLVEELRGSKFGKSHELVLPRTYDHSRSQNSLLLLRKELFVDLAEVDIPADGWEAGDLLVVTATLRGTRVTLASFHGDTNGLLTIPMLKQVAKHLPTKSLLFGMDANTYEHESSSTAHVLEFEREYRALGLRSCWPVVKPSRYTTFNARTYLQPQLNKAAKSSELAEKGDRNPKDFIVFSSHFAASAVWRDNTGRGEFVEDMVFPTLEFPSDHAVLSADLLFSLAGALPEDAKLEL